MSVTIDNTSTGSVVIKPGASGSSTFIFPVDNGTNGYFLQTDGAGVLSWASAGTGSGSVTSVDITPPAAGITTSGGPITTSGSITLALADDLAAVEGLSTTGIAARTGTSTWVTRTITGTASNISVTNGTGVSGNPTIDLIDVGTPVTGQFVKITTDAKGRITATTAVTSGDITPLVNGSYVQKAGDTMTGSLSFSGTGLKITGDMTNSTIASRLLFQTTTSNSATAITAVPSGTSTISAFQAYTGTTTNESYVALSISGAGGTASVSSAITGTGTVLPLTLSVGGTDRLRADTAGNIVIGTAALSAGATDGFLYLTTSPGDPGTPTTYTGRAPMVWDSSNSALKIYSGGAWNAVGAGSGSVSNVSVVTANGFAGTVANSTTTPAITLTTSITGVLKGSSNALVAATAGSDYSAGTASLSTGILKSTTGTGALTIAVAGDFPILNQNTTGSAATLTTPRTINGVSFDGSANIVVTAAAGTLTGNTLAAGVTASSLTSVGTITTGTWNGTTIAIANGGTGQTTKTAAFNALSPVTTVGDLIVGNGTNSQTRLPVGTDGQVLTADSTQPTGVKWAAGGGGGSGDTNPTPNTLAQRDSNADLYANNFVSSSDARLKDNITAINNALEVVQQLNGVSYNFKGSDKTTYGLIAQHVQQILPNIVYENSDGMMGVNYSALIAYLIESIKQLQDRIAVLESA